MDSSVSPKDEIWFLRVCHHISNAVYVESLGELFCMEGSQIHHFGESSLLQREIVQCFGDPFRFHHQEMICCQALRRIFLTPSWGNDQTSNVSDINSDSIISKRSEDRCFGDCLEHNGMINVHLFGGRLWRHHQWTTKRENEGLKKNDFSYELKRLTARWVSINFSSRNNLCSFVSQQHNRWGRREARIAEWYTKKVNLFLFTPYKRMGGVNRGIAPLILNPGDGWSELWASRPCCFTPGQGILQYQLNSRLGVPQGRSASLEEPLAHNANRISVHPTSRPVIVSTNFSWFPK